jgi:protein-S-isoprenylcysteine O-methyltransferase Ste14
MAAAAWSRRTQARPGLAAELPYRILTIIGFVLIFSRAAGLWPPLAATVQWALVLLAGAGFAFCWWARLHLGALWSSSVTRKQDHRIVDTGPYALVRHPIYTGMIAAALAAAALSGTAASLAGFAAFTLGCWLKARLEERFLRAELGAADYDAYARRTGMLLPFL